MAYWVFKRAKGFMDIVCYTANTSTNHRIEHNLGVTPELIITKSRSNSSGWYSYLPSSLGGGIAKYLRLDSANGFINSISYWGSAAPTVTDFGISDFDLFGNNWTVVAYLFATLPGISKVGSYTGNGSSQTIACGFTTGARFIMIKRTDSTGDWYIWDSARGIVSANDPHLSLNTTVAEVTTDDSVDPDNSGFIVNQVAATNINVTSATYIFLAIA